MRLVIGPLVLFGMAAIVRDPLWSVVLTVLAILWFVDNERSSRGGPE